MGQAETNALSNVIIGAALRVHRAQLLSYLKLADKPLGLLINSHVQMLKDGTQRIVSNFDAVASQQTSAFSAVKSVPREVPTR